MSGILIGMVIAGHQHDNSLDVQLARDDSVLYGVPLVGPAMTTAAGLVNMPHPEGDQGSQTVVSYVVLCQTDGGYIAIGFISPQVNQMNFDRKNFKIDRHASDVYSTIDENGNIELSHPSGTFARIATSPGHEDLTGKDHDGLWAISKNKAAVWLSVVIANAGSVKAEIKIDPAGNVTINHAGSLMVNTSESATINAKSITLNAPTTINGATSINGSLLQHNGVDIGYYHTHTDVKAGGDTTGSPS